MSVFDRASDDYARGARALVVYPDITSTALGSKSTLSAEARLEEARGLALAIGIQVVDARTYRVRSPKAGTLLGSGQIAEIAEYIADNELELLIIDGSLTAIQQRNLEDKVGAKVIDRTGLILEIFGERAATAEGRLQVELAHLDYQAGRLVRSWTHLERQRGGFGFLGGPGETQIEADRRMIRDRMAKLRKELGEVQRTRALHRHRRQKAPWPVVALVGYTNAGKSTLFNRLTGADVMAKDMLFATLDPTMREISLPGIDKVILSDTVGFVSDLPTQLVAAFRATLEEVTSADLIVHVRDIAHEDSDAQRLDVIHVLAELGIDANLSLDKTTGEGEDADQPIVIEAWNKIDLLSNENKAEKQSAANHSENRTALSAISGEGLEDFCETLSEWLTKEEREHSLMLSLAAGKALAWLHEHGRVLNVRHLEQAQQIHVRLNERNLGRFFAQFQDNVID